VAALEEGGVWGPPNIWSTGGVGQLWLLPHTHRRSKAGLGPRLLPAEGEGEVTQMPKER
jgi:hypothetical protein